MTSGSGSNNTSRFSLHQAPQESSSCLKYLCQEFQPIRPRPIPSHKMTFRAALTSDLKLLKKNQYKKASSMDIHQLSLDNMNWRTLKDLQKTIKRMKGTGSLRLDLQECSFKKLKIFMRGLEEKLKDVKKFKVNFVEFKEKFNSCASVLFRKIKQLKKMETLQLNFLDCNFIKDSTIQKLDREFQCLSLLKVLEMDFNNCQRIDIQKDTNFLLKVRFPQTLKALRFNFANFEIKSARWLRYFAAKLKRHRGLKILDLNFSGAHHFNDGDIIALSAIFANLRSISKLSLNFLTCEDVTPKGLEILSQSVKGLRCLSELQLYFSFYLNYSQHQIISQEFADNLSSLRALTSLKLDFSYSQSLCEDDFKNLALCLGGMDQLKHLKLNFTGCVKMSNNALKLIAKALKKKRHLITLDMKFECFIHFVREKLLTDEGIQAIAESLRGLKGLNVLNLNLEDCSLSYEGIGALTQSIAQLHNLIELKVIFNEKMYWNNRPIMSLFKNNKKRLAIFFEGLKHCSSLKKLHLDFPTSELTHQQVTNFGQSLKNMHQLSKLKLRFAPSKKASGTGAVESLFSALKLMSSLSVLSLSFHKDSLCEGDFRSLLVNLKEIKLLSKLKLNIEKSRRYGERLTEDMTLALRELVYLKSLKLDYATYDNLRTGKDLFTLIMRLTSLKSLQHLLINYTSRLRQCEMMNILKELDYKTKFRSLRFFSLNDDIII